MGNESLFPDVPFSFGPKFLHDHAGHIITDPLIALVELIANAYDAGASLVDTRWPDVLGESFQVIDNGTGVTAEEFNRRWKTLSYSRPGEQGLYVEYPPGVKGAKRIAFGQNGKGRYAPFCFSDGYQVETWKNGKGFHHAPHQAGAKALVLEPCLRRGRLLAGHLRAILNGGRSIEIRHETLHCLVWLLQSIF
jgi:hypothetical protein